MGDLLKLSVFNFIYFPWVIFDKFDDQDKFALLLFPLGYVIGFWLINNNKNDDRFNMLNVIVWFLGPAVPLAIDHFILDDYFYDFYFLK